MTEKKGQNFLHGAAIYAAGVVVIKILGFIYKFVIMRVMSDAGYGYFMVAYNVFNVFLTISTAGIPVALSRMISEADALGLERQKLRTFDVATLTLLVLGGLGTLLMMLFPGKIAAFMGSANATPGIFMIAPSLVLVCLIAALRGYCQGHADMVPTTVSQIVETAVKVVIGLSLTLLFIHWGKSESLTAAAAVSGTTISSLATLIYMFTAVKRRFSLRPRKDTTEPVDSRRKIFWNFLKIAVPITISGGVLSLVNLLDTKLVLNCLSNIGYSATEAETLYGVYAKTMNLYNLPYYFVIPLGASIMPAIAGARTRGERGEAARLAEDSLRIMTLVCLPMAVGLGVLSAPCVELVSNCYAAEAPVLMSMMAVASYVMCFAVMLNSILPANGNERLPLYSILAGGAVKIAVNWVLVSNPSVNIYGAPVGTICCYLVIAGVNLVFVSRNMERPMNLGRILGRSGLSGLVMGVVVWLLWRLTTGIFGGTLIPFALSVIAGVAVYAVMIILLRAVTLEDMKLIPKGEKIARLLHIR